jgi:hypothetical protein
MCLIKKGCGMLFFQGRSKFLSSLIVFAAVICLCTSAGFADGQFTPISKGVEYGIFSSRPAGAGEAKIHVLRIDPGRAKLGLLLASEEKIENKTVSDWCKDYRMIAAINAGMYLKDYKTNVGYLRKGPYVQNKRWNKKYLSVLAFNPKIPGIEPAVLVDVDTQDPGRILDKLNNYDSVVQNLRLMKGNGINVWGKSDKKWSESAIGIDQQGRILFIFCGYPHEMWQFNEMIKSLGIGVTRMMHLEGGPIASMSIRAKNLKLDLAGSYESNSNSVGNGSQYAIPNVIGVFE